MSNLAVAWAYAQEINKPVKKFVLVTVADHANGVGLCFPGQKRLCRMLGAGERTVRRHLDELEREGYIARRERRRKDGTRTSDLYQLDPTGQFGLLAMLTEDGESINRPNWPKSPAKLAGHEPSVEPKDLTPPTPPAAEREAESDPPPAKAGKGKGLLSFLGKGSQAVNPPEGQSKPSTPTPPGCVPPPPPPPTRAEKAADPPATPGKGKDTAPSLWERFKASWNGGTDPDKFARLLRSTKIEQRMRKERQNYPTDEAFLEQVAHALTFINVDPFLRDEYATDAMTLLRHLDEYAEKGRVLARKQPARTASAALRTGQRVRHTTLDLTGHVAFTSPNVVAVALDAGGMEQDHPSAWATL